MGNNFNSLKINDIKYDFRPYAICETAGNTSVKVVNVANFTLFDGASVIVKFANANTAANPQLNVNSTNAKPILYNGASLPSSQHWAAGTVIEFIYDGTNWNINGVIKDNNTTYSAATATSSGLVSTGVQTFGGTKTFSTINTNNINTSTINTDTINDNGGALNIINNNNTSTSLDYISIESTYGQISLWSKYGVQVFDTSGNINTITANLDGNADTASKLETHRTIDGVEFDGSTDITHHGSSSTDAGTADKTVSISNFVLETGSKISVKFTYANTAAYPTLDVNSTGPKSILYNGATLTSSQHWAAGAVVEFIYDGSYWNVVGTIKDNNTNYYPTAFSWTGGTTSGPTGSLTGSGMTAVSFGAIPSASSSASGIVTTGAQTFGGTKTFSSININSINDNGNTLNIINNNNTSSSKDYIKIESTYGQISLWSKNGVQVFDTSGSIGTITANLNGKLVTPRNIDGVKFDGSADITHHGSSSTNSGTADKTVSITGFELKTGSKISVKFTYANTASTPTLNVSSTGAKTIRYNGSNLPSTQYWSSGAVVEFIYDGSYWNVVGTIKDNNTTYSAATASSSGLMSTGSQTFSGKKTFNSNIIADLDGNADTASKLETSRTIDGMSFNGSANIANYYYCTSAQTSYKAINLSGFTLSSGARIVVKFKNPNQAGDKLTISNKDYTIHYRGQVLPVNFWAAWQCVEFIFDGERFNIVSGTQISTISDERLKDIIGDSNKLNLDVIANAPSKIYSLKDDYFKTEYIGTIAQYWEDKVPQAILHHGENLGVDYAPLALCSAITLAREVVELKEKIKELESKLSEQ